MTGRLGGVYVLAVDYRRLHTSYVGFRWKKLLVVHLNILYFIEF